MGQVVITGKVTGSIPVTEYFHRGSLRRGETFVNRKISRAGARIKLRSNEFLYLGNLVAKRDWGYASKYVEEMW